MEPERLARFEQRVLPHLDAAWTLARWLMRDDHDAEDVVQESMVKALRFVDGLRSDDARAWLLAIVRNTAWTWLRRRRSRDLEPLADDALESLAPGPEEALARAEDRLAMRDALERLPCDLREVIVLREMEGLSYREIAEIAQVPIGTVMSRLSRARDRLDRAVAPRAPKEP